MLNIVKKIKDYQKQLQANASALNLIQAADLNSVEAQNNNSVLYFYYDVAFAKIIKTASGYSYTIYTDADMQNKIQSGNINDIEEINNIFNNYIKDNKVSMYKYTFKKGLCTYDNYCFYKGEWVK